jgi:hypothetical protein
MTISDLYEEVFGMEWSGGGMELKYLVAEAMREAAEGNEEDWRLLKKFSFRFYGTWEVTGTIENMRDEDQAREELAVRARRVSLELDGASGCASLDYEEEGLDVDEE